MSGRLAPDPGEIRDAGVREDQAQVRVARAHLDRVPAEGRDAAAGVAEDRQPPLVGEREHGGQVGVVEIEALGARVKLDAARPGIEGAAELLQGRVGRIEATEGEQAPVRGLGFGEHHVVGRWVAVRLVHREDERAGVDELQAADQLLGAAAVAVRVVLAEMRVRVEQLRTGHALAQQGEHRQESPGVDHRPGSLSCRRWLATTWYTSSGWAATARSWSHTSTICARGSRPRWGWLAIRSPIAAASCSGSGAALPPIASVARASASRSCTPGPTACPRAPTRSRGGGQSSTPSWRPSTSIQTGSPSTACLPLRRTGASSAARPATTAPWWRLDSITVHTRSCSRPFRSRTSSRSPPSSPATLCRSTRRCPPRVTCPCRCRLDGIPTSRSRAYSARTGTSSCRCERARCWTSAASRPAARSRSTSPAPRSVSAPTTTSSQSSASGPCSRSRAGAVGSSSSSARATGSRRCTRRQARHYICFEPMTAPTDALVSGTGLRFVSPGASFSARFRMRVSAPSG